MSLNAVWFYANVIIMMIAFVKLGCISDYRVHSDDNFRGNGMLFYIFLTGIIGFIASLFMLSDNKGVTEFFIYSFPILLTACWCGFACIAAALDKSKTSLRLACGIFAIGCYVVDGLINFGFQLSSLSHFSSHLLILAMLFPVKLISFVCFIFTIFGKKIRWWVNLILFILVLMIMTVYILIVHFWDFEVWWEYCFVFFVSVSFLLISSSNIKCSFVVVGPLWFGWAAIMTFCWIKDLQEPPQEELRAMASQYGKNILIKHLREI